jgi:hypothetical protein
MAVVGKLKDRMPCNKPRRDVKGGKKSVVKACEDGEEKIIRFGDANMTIKKDKPARRKSFRARHKCDQKKSKLSAGYWSCRAWGIAMFGALCYSQVGGMFSWVGII